jgi:hypothetical protein
VCGTQPSVAQLESDLKRIGQIFVYCYQQYRALVQLKSIFISDWIEFGVAIKTIRQGHKRTRKNEHKAMVCCGASRCRGYFV